MTKEEAFLRAGQQNATRIARGAGVSISTVRGRGGLPEGVAVAVALNPANTVEFIQMVNRWCLGKKLLAGMVSVQ